MCVDGAGIVIAIIIFLRTIAAFVIPAVLTLIFHTSISIRTINSAFVLSSFYLLAVWNLTD